MFQTNSFIHNINTSNKHHLHKPNANLPCLKKKKVLYVGIKIVSRLPPSLKTLNSDKA